MKIIRINSKYGQFAIIQEINDRLKEYGLQIVLFEYDDNRVYRTNERQLDNRIDGCTMRREAA